MQRESARAPWRLRRGLRLCVAACGKAAVKGRWAGVPIGPAGFVILNAGREAPGVEGSRWLRTRSGLLVILSVASLRASGVEGSRRLRTRSGLLVILSVASLRASGVEGSRWRQRLAAAIGLPRSGCARPRPGASTRSGKACGLRKPRHSRVDEQLCSSTLLSMVRPPARSPCETSTNRRVRKQRPGQVRGEHAGRGRPCPAAIGGGFVRLAAGWTCPRPACARRRRRAGRQAAHHPGAGAERPAHKGASAKSRFVHIF